MGWPSTSSWVALPGGSDRWRRRQMWLAGPVMILAHVRLRPPSLLRFPRFSVTATAIILRAFGLFGGQPEG